MDIIKGADKTLSVLEYIMEHDESEFTITGLSKELNYGKTVIYRIIQTLLQRGYLVKNERYDTYSPSLKLMELGARAQEKFQLHKVVRPYLEKLSRETDETVNLGILTDLEVTYLDKIDCSNFLRTDLRVGTRVPAFCTGLGKAILSVHPEQDVILDKLELKAYTPKTITSRTNLEQELEQAKEQEFALDDEEYIHGVRCLASPIYSSMKIAPAAISVAGPTFRLSEGRLEMLIEKLKEVSHELNEGLFSHL